MLLPELEKYPHFRQLKLSPEPEGTDETLISIFRPDTEPKPENHLPLLSSFEMWLKQPLVNPQNYPQDARNIETPIGAWIFICSRHWGERYEVKKKRVELGVGAFKGALTSSVLVVLGVVGFDGDVEGIEEWLASVGAVLARWGLPMPFAAREAIEEKNQQLAKSIERHFHANAAAERGHD